jgi:glutamate synthase domain-containing protein 2
MAQVLNREGGQLPGAKVLPWIAEIKSTPYVGLISLLHTMTFILRIYHN